MAGNCAARLAQNLDHPPEWLDGFAGYLAIRLSPARAVTLLHQLAGVLASSSNNVPAAVLAAARQPQPGHLAGGALTRALEAFFASARLALPGDTAAQAAAARRRRRVDETPQAFRAAAASFSDAQLHDGDRARRAGTLWVPKSRPPYAAWEYS
jgi:hypothetical protein